MQRHSTVLFPVMVLIAIVLGGSLYLFGGSLFESTAPQSAERAGFTVLAEGTNALGVDQRANYRIRTAEEYQQLWQFMFNGEGASMPVVDFTEEEVLAVFNGSHATTGFRVSILEVREVNGVRSITIERREPGAACTVSSQITSPYILIRLPKSTLPIERNERTIVDSCR